MYAQTDARVTVIHKPNGGVSNMRNCGLQGIKGKYVFFCDSDDLMLPDCLKNAVDAAEAKGAALVKFTYQKQWYHGENFIKTTEQKLPEDVFCHR